MPRFRFAPLALLLSSLLLGACVHARAAEAPDLPAWASAPPDTIVLVRTRCFGQCPAYELVIPRGGTVHVRGDAERAARAVASVPDAVLDSLGRQAVAGGFFALPPSTAGDDDICPVRATDHPTVTVRLVQGRQRTEVQHYAGCYTSADPPRMAPAARALMALADAIDAAAGTGAAPR